MVEFMPTNKMELMELIELIRQNEKYIPEHREILMAYLKITKKEGCLIAFFKDVFGVRKKNYLKLFRLLDQIDLYKLSFRTINNLSIELETLKKKDIILKIKEDPNYVPWIELKK